MREVHDETCMYNGVESMTAPDMGQHTCSLAQIMHVYT